MSNLPDRSRFESAYAGQAPWDIGRPQPVFVGAADQIAGSLLDSGCGTGDNALFFAARGLKVTGIDFLAEPIERAKRKAAQRGLQVNFLVMDALALSAIPEQFDYFLLLVGFSAQGPEETETLTGGGLTIHIPENSVDVNPARSEVPEPGAAVLGATGLAAITLFSRLVRRRG